MREHRVGEGRVQMSLLVPFVAVDELGVSVLSIRVRFVVEQGCVAQGERT